ncbi:hypothetical protein C8J57DRAFT_1309950 [Mycena rebaudengoi]|nr:hypothetical protein C8J57DRAFT_1309950 [Mycena rebaudengoi]
MTPEHAVRSPANTNKPLPSTTGRGSDLSASSLAPSQSASQIDLVPSAEPVLSGNDGQHIYSDAPLPLPSPSLQSHSSGHQMTLPSMRPDNANAVQSPYTQTTTTNPYSLPFQAHVLPRRITEEDLLRSANAERDEDAESSVHEDAGGLRIVENPRFAGMGGNAKGKAKAKAGGSGGGTLKREPLRRGSTYGSTLSVPVPGSGGKGGFFGSLRGLFGRKGGSDLGVKGRWGKGRDADADGSEDGQPPTPAPRQRVFSDVGSQRHKRGNILPAAASDRKAEDGARKAEEWVGGQGRMFAEPGADHEADKGWASDGEIPTVKRRKSKSKAQGTIRSIASSAASGSTADVMVLPSRQKRRASLGVTADTSAALAPSPPVPTGTMSTLRAERRASMPVHPAPRPAGEGASLMSIVEGVARANRQGWASNGSTSNVVTPGSAPSSNSTGLLEVKAPRLDAPVPQTRVANIEGLPRSFSAPVRTFSTPPIPSTFAGPEGSSNGSGSGSGLSPASSLKRPAKSPFPSALRNSSPSPVPPLPVKPAAVPVPIPVPAPVLNGSQQAGGSGKGKGKAVEVERDEDEDDAASISSYETGHEMFDEDGDETEHEDDRGRAQPPPPPPHDYTNVNGNGKGNAQRQSFDSAASSNLIDDYGRGGSDLSASTASTPTSGLPTVGAPQRRKSVRVSLQPTFSATPPAIDEDEDDEDGQNRHAPWGNSKPTPDMWEDSSEEDVEYQKAKKLLNRIARKDKKGR